ncbi:hypothetical protein BJX70DRAFT_402852 [Aspergillus crustosus]
MTDSLQSSSSGKWEGINTLHPLYLSNTQSTYQPTKQPINQSAKTTMQSTTTTKQPPSYASAIHSTTPPKFIDWWGSGKEMQDWPVMYDGYDYGLRRPGAPWQYVFGRQIQPTREYLVEMNGWKAGTGGRG